MGNGVRRAVNGVRRTLSPSGFFVVLEGIDGAGKSEQSRRLAAWFASRGESVVQTFEPTDGPWGRKYRAWAKGEFEATADQVLEFFALDRREHVDTLIKPALAAGDTVVCDRYIASTLAYQAAQGIDRERVAAAMEKYDFPQPNLVLWLRLPVETAVGRMGAERERFERAAFLEKVDAEYERLGLDPLDASGDVDTVTVQITERVERELTECRARNS